MSNVTVIEETQLQTVQQAPRALAPVHPGDLLRHALDSGVDLDRLEKLMELQERYEANQALMAFVDAMANFKKHAPTIYKDKNVSFTGTSYNHATLGGICEAVIGLLAQHGISHDWDAEQPANGMIVVTCTLTHNLGHSKSTKLQSPPDNSGKKNGIQQVASTITYLQRYTLLSACGLATQDIPDDDGRNADPEPTPRVPPSLNAARLADAIESIRKGEYTVEKLKANFTLTVDQLTLVDDEFSVPK